MSTGSVDSDNDQDENQSRYTDGDEGSESDSEEEPKGFQKVEDTRKKRKDPPTADHSSLGPRKHPIHSGTTAGSPSPSPERDRTSHAPPGRQEREKGERAKKESREKGGRERAVREKEDRQRQERGKPKDTTDAADSDEEGVDSEEEPIRTCAQTNAAVDVGAEADAARHNSRENGATDERGGAVSEAERNELLKKPILMKSRKSRAWVEIGVEALLKVPPLQKDGRLGTLPVSVDQNSDTKKETRMAFQNEVMAQNYSEAQAATYLCASGAGKVGKPRFFAFWLTEIEAMDEDDQELKRTREELGTKSFYAAYALEHNTWKALQSTINAKEYSSKNYEYYVFPVPDVAESDDRISVFYNPGKKKPQDRRKAAPSKKPEPDKTQTTLSFGNGAGKESDADDEEPDPKPQKKTDKGVVTQMVNGQHRTIAVKVGPNFSLSVKYGQVLIQDEL